MTNAKNILNLIRNRNKILSCPNSSVINVSYKLYLKKMMLNDKIFEKVSTYKTVVFVTRF